MFDALLTAEGLISLLTLTLLEIVLGIDNVIFISILSGRLPEKDQKKARTVGLVIALLIRIGLLCAISVIIHWSEPLFTVFEQGISVRDLILFAGGLFLLYKSTVEIHHRLEGDEENFDNKSQMTMMSAIIQIVMLDIVFSFDSILTAIGLVDEVIIMVVAVVISLGIMLFFSGLIAGFINKHPTIKMLALAFLLMIGLLLILESFEQEVDKKFVYFAMAFSLFVEFLNLRARKKGEPVKLRRKYPEPEEEDEMVAVVGGK